jgi:hypothetical protein|tara:strand:- start:667 stop:1224 length:558 start_codon:yes stop_codon:yes gene_type:complete
MNGYIDSIFPTNIFVFDFDVDEVSSVISDFIIDEENMKRVDNNNPNNGSCGSYYTDFYNPCTNKAYEKLLDNIYYFFQERKMNATLIAYWSAVYIDHAMHSAHVHSSKMRPNFDNCNYSSVLCLSDLGETRFLSSNNCSDDVDYIYSSKVGRMLVFPSNLFHDASSNKTGIRRIISSNLEIKNVY